MAETPSPAPLVRANPTRTNAASPWREALILEFGIHPLAEPPPPDRSILWTTRCAATKSSTGQGLPHELYHSRITGPFYRFVAQHGLRYGVL